MLRKPERVAEQRDPLRLAIAAPVGELLRLLQGQHRLPAAGATAHLDPVEQPGHVQDGRLFLGQSVGLCGALLGLGVHVVLRGHPAGEDVDDDLDVGVRRRGLALSGELRVVEALRDGTLT